MLYFFPTHKIKEIWLIHKFVIYLLTSWWFTNINTNVNKNIYKQISIFNL